MIRSIRIAAVVALLFSAASVRAQDLPKDAQALIEENQKRVDDIERQAAAQTQAAYEALQAKLDKLKVDYTKEGKLDEAVAIRDFLRAGIAAKLHKPLSDPGNLTAFRSEVGRVILFELTGATGFSAYGTDIYTHDTPLATAAVHAGVLKLGEKGIVKVTILPAQKEFAGTGRNGVSTSSWSASNYECYKVEPVRRISVPTLSGAAPLPAVAALAADVRPDPGNLAGYRDQAGKSFVFEVTGANDWGIYGSDVYTDDSELDVVAVHAGLLKVGQKGLVKVTLLGSGAEFKSTSRNGVTSRSWGGYNGSYKVEAASKVESIKDAIKDSLKDAIKDALK